LKQLRIGQIYELRKRYFGNELAAAPKDKERKAKTIELLQECYNNITKQFHFRIMRLDGEEFDEVCEGAYLVALGKHGNMNTNQVRFDNCIINTINIKLISLMTNIGIKILDGCEEEACEK